MQDDEKQSEAGGIAAAAAAAATAATMPPEAAAAVAASIAATAVPVSDSVGPADANSTSARGAYGNPQAEINSSTENGQAAASIDFGQ